MSSKEYNNKIDMLVSDGSVSDDDKMIIVEYEKGLKEIEENIKNILAILGPFATAATGYFFVSASSPSAENISTDSLLNGLSGGDSAPGADPGTNQGGNPGTNQGGNPGANQGGNPGANQGGNPGTNQGGNPGANQGGNPDG